MLSSESVFVLSNADNPPVVIPSASLETQRKGSTENVVLFFCRSHLRNKVSQLEDS